MQQQDNRPLLLIPAHLSNIALTRRIQELTILNVVLADDDPDEQYFFETAVKQLPMAIKLEEVTDGVRLLELLLDARFSLPDIIFLDIMMPRKNGIECLREIKCNDILKDIPVIMYSNSVSTNYIVAAYECGALHFLQKGNYDELPASIGQLLSLAIKKPGQVTIQNFMFK